MKDTMELKGNVWVMLRDSRGRIKARRHVHNTVPANGLAHIADRLDDGVQAQVGWMAVGTGIPAATLLGNEIDRNALTSRVASGAVIEYVGDWAAGEATTILTEAGLFNIGSLNTVTMLAAATYGAIVKAAGDSLKITWTLTFS